MYWEDMRFTQMYCPNCGHKAAGYRDGKGALKRTCSKCGATIFSKVHKKNEIDIKVIRQ